MSNVTRLSDHQPRKQLDITPEMLTQISAVAGTAVAMTDIVVFEATAINTRPLNKSGSIFDKGRLTRATLTEMAERLNNNVEAVPLHTLHLQGDEIPVGKVFFGSVHDLEDGSAELRAQFYLASNETLLIEKMNLGILDEVSVGLKTKHMFCSECGFDYMGTEANSMNFWDRTCDAGHVIGEDGVHVLLAGVESWMELSLVSRGAAHKAKIHGRAKQALTQEQQDRIAASGLSLEAVTLFASPQSESKEEPGMAKDPAVAVTTTAAAAEFDAKVAFEGLNTKFDELLAALKPAEVVAEKPTEIAALKAEIEELKAQVTEIGKPKVEDLKADLPTGGVAASTVTDAEKRAAGPNFGAFKARK